MKPLLAIFLLTVMALALGWTWSERPKAVDVFKPHWTNSVRLYGQPHAIWLDRYDRVGANLPLLQKTLQSAAQAKQVPELVIYAIPLRDLGQASEGGFATDTLYWRDNQQNAQLIGAFVQQTGIHPVIYLEPDSLPLAVQYRRDQQDSEESVDIYQRRVQLTRRLIALYQQAGAKVYLEAGHSGWFDYGDADLSRIANVLNEAGVEQADGVASNISNRQPVSHNVEKNEFHYLSQLMPRLKQIKPLDVRVDTSRNGGHTKARQYYLHPEGFLIDNERPSGRLVGHWSVSSQGGVTIRPFFGKVRSLSRLTEKEKYQYDSKRNVLMAPPWLDAVGDVKLGPPPTDTPPDSVKAVIGHYRYIKPPDDCDGALNCPPGASKQQIWMDTENRQTEQWSLPAKLW